MRQIAKPLLLSLLPILVFVLAEELYGTVAGLWAALVFSAGEGVYIYVREKRFDKFILFDIGLVSLFGGISLISDSPLFFKLKPAVLEAAIAAVVAVSLWGPLQIIQGMMKRQMNRASLSVDFDHPEIRKSLSSMFFLLLLHVFLTVAAALWASSEVWGFVSGFLLYIMVFVLLFGKFMVMKVKNRQ